MRRVIAILLVALYSVGCVARDEQVPLPTVTVPPPTVTVPPPTVTVPPPTVTEPPPTVTEPPPTDTVPLPTSEFGLEQPSGCVLAYRVVDVIADPASGTPIVRGGGEPLLWPRGYTARRAGSEVEVLDPAGTVVLTTGGRYWMCPADDWPQWVIGNVRPCPQRVRDKLFGWYDCKLGSGVL